MCENWNLIRDIYFTSEIDSSSIEIAIMSNLITWLYTAQHIARRTSSPIHRG